MSITDVQVTITLETRGITQRGFGLPLVLSTEKTQAYTLYRSLSDVADDFISTTETYKMAAAIFSQSPRPVEIAILGIDSTVPSELTDGLDAAINAGNDGFYFVLSHNQTPAIQDALSSWTAAAGRLYFTSTSDVAYPGTKENNRMAVVVHSDPTSYPCAAWVGQCAPQLPGSINWKFRVLNGIPESTLTNTEINTVLTGNGNVVKRQGGVLHTANGTCTDGTFIDIIRTLDFIEARTKENIFARLINSKKIPFDNTGIATVVEGVNEALQTAFNNGAIAQVNPAELEGRQPTPDEEGILVPGFIVTAPDRSEVPMNDRANRILPNVNFVAIISGAINEVRVFGRLTV